MPQTTLRPSTPTSTPRVLTNLKTISGNQLVTLVTANVIQAKK
jgi:hypothetical protein